MIADTWLLIQLRWQVTWNTFKRRSFAGRLFAVLGGAFAAILTGGGAALVGLALGAILRAFPNPDLAALLPGALLTFITLLLVLSSFGATLGSLFLTNDLDTLMSAPIDVRAVFLSKMLDGMTPSYLIISVSALPALLAYGLGVGYGPLYFVGVLLAILATPLLPMGLASVLVMLVARVAPVRRVREILGLMGALFGVGCAVIGNTSRYWAAAVIPNETNAQTALKNVESLATIPVPPLMAGRGLGALGSGDWGVAVVSFGAFLGISFGFFALCVWLANSLYMAGWLRMQSSGNARRSRMRNERAAAHSGLLGRGPAWLAVVFKDWRVIPRDLRNFAQMLAPLIFLPVIFYNLLNSTGRRGENAFQEIGRTAGGIDSTGVLICAGLLTVTLFALGRLAETAISMESKSWWVIKAAPISASEILLGKFVSAIVPFAAVSTLLMVIADIWKRFNLGWALYGWFGVELLGLGLLAVSVGLSVPWARLDWDDPRRMLTWQTAVVTLAAWALLGLVGGVCLCLPVLAQLIDSELVGVMMVLGVIMATVLMVGTGYAAFRFGVSKLNEVGEQ